MGSCIGTSRVSKVLPLLRRASILRPAPILNLSYAPAERQVIQLYLPEFDFHSRCTRTQQELVAWHWETVFHGLLVVSGQSNARHPIGKLYKLFYEYIDQFMPDLKAIFPTSMAVRARVLAHITSGLYPLLNASPETLPDHVKRLTITHHRRLVRPEHFNSLGKALVHAVSAVSGPMYWTPEIENAWRRMFCQCSVLLLIQQVDSMEKEGLEVRVPSPAATAALLLQASSSSSTAVHMLIKAKKKSSRRKIVRAQTTGAVPRKRLEP